VESLLSFLHERGFVMYFGKDDKSTLKDIVFLSPKWLADVMKSVVCCTFFVARLVLCTCTNLSVI
jgi:hypothetical protein